MARPDGLISPGGLTWKKLAGSPAAGGSTHDQGASFVQLPQNSYAYYTYNKEPQKQFGTPDTIRSLQEISVSFFTEARIKMGIGDISFENGAQMSPHHAHRLGRDADIRPIRTDDVLEKVTIQDKEYSRERTKVLVKILLQHPNVHRILFNALLSG